MSINKSVPTFTAVIWVGTRLGYTETVFPLSIAQDVIQEYVNADGWCVTITPTEYRYKNGSEPGFSVGIINYPRFPEPTDRLKKRSLELAEKLLVAYQQGKVTVVFPDETVMLEAECPGAL